MLTTTAVFHADYRRGRGEISKTVHVVTCREDIFHYARSPGTRFPFLPLIRF